MSFGDDFNALVLNLSEQAGFALELKNNTTAFKYDDVVVVLDLPDEHEPFLYAYASLFPIEKSNKALLFENLLICNMPNVQIPGIKGPCIVPRIAYEKEDGNIYCWDKIDIASLNQDMVKARLSAFCEACTALVNKFGTGLQEKTESGKDPREIIKGNYIRV